MWPARQLPLSRGAGGASRRRGASEHLQRDEDVVEEVAPPLALRWPISRWRDELRERAEQVGDVVDRFGARARRAFGEDVQAAGDAVVRAAQRAVPAAYAGRWLIRA